MTVTGAEIRRAIQTLGLAGETLEVHSSLRSFGHVEGGADAVIDALLAEDCTVLVPTFSWFYAAPAPPHLRPVQNAWDYASVQPSPGNEPIFTSAAREIDRSMGAIPAAVVARPDRFRGNHQLNSFSAIGPLARHLVSGQRPDDVYAPLDALVAERGWVLLMGVELTSMTLLHLAEKRAGRALFRRWARAVRGDIEMVETGSCSMGFHRFEPVLGPLARETRVGASHWRSFPAAETVEAATQAIRSDPTITHCHRDECERCRDAIRGGPILPPGQP